MSIIKHDTPLFEYDPTPTAVLSPTHEQLDLTLPKKAVLAFLGGTVTDYAARVNAKQVAINETITKEIPIYVLNHHGSELCLCEAPLGAPAATQLLDWLIGYGVREIIATGSCGALEHLEENAFFIPTKALRDEGTSYHYLPPARFAEPSPVATAAIEKTMQEKKIPYRKVTTWTTDGIYRETKEKIALRKSEGCSVVEMECAALAACAAFRGAVFGQLLYTADTLADPDHYDERGWGKNARQAALTLSLDSACKL